MQQTAGDSAARFAVKQFSTPYHFSGWMASPSPPTRTHPVKSAQGEPQTVRQFSGKQYMTNIVSPKIDMSFDEWVKFIFDHPVSDDVQSAWYWDDQLNEFWGKWTFSEDRIAIRQLEYATKLFQDSAFLLECYSPEQINQGFWFLLSGHSSFALANFIWSTELDWNLREQCIRSMAKPFQIVFMQLPEQDSCTMWWDMLRNFEDGIDMKVVEAMFQTMIEILQFPSLACQVSALHGLGHIKHNGKRKVIEDYLQVNLDLDKETQDYALAAIEGKIL